MTKKPEITIPLSALWKTPLGWILMLGLASFLGLGGVGMMAKDGDSTEIKVAEHTVRLDNIEDHIHEIKDLLKDIKRDIKEIR